MRLWPTSVRAALAGAHVVLSAAGASAQEGDLAAARELYASASYDDALAVLNRLRSADHPANQSRAIEQYRAFCLLALGRAADAQQAIEAVVAAEPSYQPNESDVSPRVRTAFADVRRRMLPAIIQQKYALAKTAFDRKDVRRRPPTASARCSWRWPTRPCRPKRRAAALRPAHARGRFRGAERQGRGAAAAAAATAAAAPVVAAPPPPPPAPSARLLGRGRECHSAQRHQPDAARLSRARSIAPRSGILEVLINETGEIESAVMTQIGDVRPTTGWRSRRPGRGATSRRASTASR